MRPISRDRLSKGPVGRRESDASGGILRLCKKSGVTIKFLSREIERFNSVGDRAADIRAVVSFTLVTTAWQVRRAVEGRRGGVLAIDTQVSMPGVLTAHDVHPGGRLVGNAIARGDPGGQRPAGRLSAADQPFQGAWGRTVTRDVVVGLGHRSVCLAALAFAVLWSSMSRGDERFIARRP